MGRKRVVCFFGGLLVLLGAVFFVQALIPGTMHSGSEVLVEVDGYTMNLQEAINEGYLTGENSPSGDLADSAKHNSEDIYVSVDGDDMTLQEAINDAEGLCGSGSFEYSGSVIFGHLASEVQVTIDGGEMTLQEAINGGYLCNTCDADSWPSNRGNYCADESFVQVNDCGDTRTVTGTVTCDDGNECTTDTCSGGSCVSTNVAGGTSCGTNRVCNNGGDCCYHGDEYSWVKGYFNSDKYAYLKWGGSTLVCWHSSGSSSLSINGRTCIYKSNPWSMSSYGGHTIGTLLLHLPGHNEYSYSYSYSIC